MKIINLQIQEAQQTLNRIHTRKITSMNIIIKLLKLSGKNKTLSEASGKKQQVMHKKKKK